ncbi:MAG: hypothetical protein KDA58_07430 [Planctomycetaceae bacterium]|nr:hypothetical protein [Planctomycetaceae bacterium]
MRPQLRSSFQLVELFDEVQSLLIQYDRSAYDRQNLPTQGVSCAHRAGASSNRSVDAKDAAMDASDRSQPSQVQEQAAPEVPAGRLTGSARAERLARIRAEIADGTYDTKDRFEKALDRLCESLLAD